MNTLAVVAALAAAVAAALVLPARPGRRLRSLVQPGVDRDGHAGPARSRPPAAGIGSGVAGLLPGRRGRRAIPVPGALVLDLVAAVLEGGAAPVTAVQRVGAALSAVADPAAQALDRCGGALAAARPSPRAPSVAAGRGDLGPVGSEGGSLETALTEALLLAVNTGLAPAPLVRRAAAQHRRRSALASSAAAQRLGVLLMLPTGICLLPAFAFLGLAPLAIDLFAQVAPALG